MVTAPWLIEALKGLETVHGRAMIRPGPAMDELMIRLGLAEDLYLKVAEDAAPTTPEEKAR